MAKISIKLDKQFLSKLTGSLSKSYLEGDKKLISLFDLINIHKKDNTIDIKEITDFANSIFTADANNDGEVDNRELEIYVKNNEDKFKELKIKAKDILKFLDTFVKNADWKDRNNMRINRRDGSYSIDYYETIDGKKVEKQLNYNKDNIVETIKTTEYSNGKRIVTEDAEGKILSEERYDAYCYLQYGYTYEYKGNKTIIKNKYGSNTNLPIKEIETLEDGKVRITEYRYDFDLFDKLAKTAMIKTDENGNSTKDAQYSENYNIKINKYLQVSLKTINEDLLSNNQIDIKSFNIYKSCSKNIIQTLAKEENTDFKNTYIKLFVDKAVELAELTGINCDELKAIQKDIETKGLENVSVDDINTAYSTVFERIEKADMDISDSKISNDYYTSEKNYTFYLCN